MDGRTNDHLNLVSRIAGPSSCDILLTAHDALERRYIVNEYIFKFLTCGWDAGNLRHELRQLAVQHGLELRDAGECIFYAKAFNTKKLAALCDAFWSIVLAFDDRGCITEFIVHCPHGRHDACN